MRVERSLWLSHSRELHCYSSTVTLLILSPALFRNKYSSPTHPGSLDLEALWGAHVLEKI